MLPEDSEVSSLYPTMQVLQLEDKQSLKMVQHHLLTSTWLVISGQGLSSPKPTAGPLAKPEKGREERGC